MANQRPYDITIMGWGMRGRQHLTLENIDALKRARDVVVNPGAPDDILEFLSSLNVRIHTIDPLYRDGEKNINVYKTALAKVLSLGKRYGGTVFMGGGHPVIYNMTTQMILKESPKIGLKAVVQSGISSIDQILSLLGIDIADRDLLIYFGQKLCTQNRKIDPRMDLIILQPGGVGESTICRSIKDRPKRKTLPLYERLQSQLEKFYPKNHPLLSIQLNGALDGGDLVVKATVGQVVELAPYLTYGHTFYIKARS